METKAYTDQYHEEDVDSRELGILDGRYEMAMQIENLIKNWEKKLWLLNNGIYLLIGRMNNG